MSVARVQRARKIGSLVTEICCLNRPQLLFDHVVQSVREVGVLLPLKMGIVPRRVDVESCVEICSHH
jgi:hypothetical protein